MGLDRGKATLGKQDGQRDFFDGYVEQRLLPKEHELLKSNERIDFSFVALCRFACVAAPAGTLGWAAPAVQPAATKACSALRGSFTKTK